jgi:hypothetical protein
VLQLHPFELGKTLAADGQHGRSCVRLRLRAQQQQQNTYQHPFSLVPIPTVHVHFTAPSTANGTCADLLLSALVPVQANLNRIMAEYSSQPLSKIEEDTDRDRSVC